MFSPLTQLTLHLLTARYSFVPFTVTPLSFALCISPPFYGTAYVLDVNNLS